MDKAAILFFLISFCFFGPHTPGDAQGLPLLDLYSRINHGSAWETLWNVTN